MEGEANLHRSLQCLHRTSSPQGGEVRVTRGGHNKILTILLSRGADPNSQTPSGKTIPLHRAAYMGHQESVKILLINGSRPDWADSDGKSPLHKCAEKTRYLAQVILHYANVALIGVQR